MRNIVIARPAQKPRIKKSCTGCGDNKEIYQFIVLPRMRTLLIMEQYKIICLVSNILKIA